MGEGAGERTEDRLAGHTGIRRPRPLGPEKSEEGERSGVGGKAGKRSHNRGLRLYDWGGGMGVWRVE